MSRTNFLRQLQKPSFMILLHISMRCRNSLKAGPFNFSERGMAPPIYFLKSPSGDTTSPGQHYTAHTLLQPTCQFDPVLHMRYFIRRCLSPYHFSGPSTHHPKTLHIGRPGRAGFAWHVKGSNRKYLQHSHCLAQLFLNMAQTDAR
jgi:hypothetical protein